MARAIPIKASEPPRDAVALLKQDHRTVESLFDEFASADESEQSSLAERICQLLSVHTQMEEELLYPAAAEALEDDEQASELVHEAKVEHNAARELISRIEGMSPHDEDFHATVTVLGEYVKHHVKEEENSLFPKLKKAEVDLKQIGAQLSDRKMALMEEMGIQAWEEPAQRRRAAPSARTPRGAAAGTRARQSRAGGRKSASSRSSSRSART